MSAPAGCLLALCALVPAACRAPEPDLTPPVPQVESWREAESAAGTWRVRWRCAPDPPQFDALARLWVEARRADGTPAEALRVDAGMPQHGHGLLRFANVESLGEGRFAVENVYLHMPGPWRVYLDLGRDGVFERVELDLEVD
jgi:hypothetical protein